MKYTIQELYRGNIEIYDNIEEFLWEIKKYLIQKVPITINYIQNNDTMTQTKKKVVSGM